MKERERGRIEESIRSGSFAGINSDERRDTSLSYSQAMRDSLGITWTLLSLQESLLPLLPHVPGTKEWLLRHSLLTANSKREKETKTHYVCTGTYTAQFYEMTSHRNFSILIFSFPWKITGHSKSNENNFSSRTQKAFFFFFFVSDASSDKG